VICVATLEPNNRAPEVLVLPDLRKRVTRRFDISNPQATMGTSARFDSEVEIPWGEPDILYPECLLIAQNEVGQNDNSEKSPNSPYAYVLRVYEELSRQDRTMVGNPNISFDQYGRKTVVIDYLQYSDGSTAYVDTVGTTAAPAPNAACILKTVESTDDGTLIRTKLTFIDSGELSRNEELRFGGKLTILTITSLGTPPATPSGYTLVTESEEFSQGRVVYRYGFAQASGGGGSGTGGVISQGFTDSQNGTVAFNPASPNSATGAVICTTRYVSTPAITTNPITQPTGFVLFAIETTFDSGYVLWETRSGFGDGLVLDETTVQQVGALITYHRIEFGAAPATPTATIGGTVTLFDSSVRNADGYLVYDYRWSEGDGQSSITTRGQGDGSIDYTVITFTAAATTPAYPGSGTAYLASITQAPQNGYFQNTAVYTKPPATTTLNQTTSFEKPGNAVFTGSPPQLVLTAPVTLTILAEVEISYGTTQLSDVPFTVSAPATFYETYTPTDTGIAVTSTQAMGRYLAGASGISGTNSVYNGILCDTWEAQLGSSTPSSFSSGLKVLKTENEIYLVATDGTIVYRRTKISYTF